MRRTACIALAATATALAGAGSVASAAPGIHAHRGGSVLGGVPTFPENTLIAFRHASREGYVLELDVKLTRDRVPVVFHDPELDRVTPCSGAVAARTHAQLRRCPVDVLGSPGGSLPTRPAPRGQPIPTLAQVLAFAREEGSVLNLEIKNQPGDGDFDPGDRFARDVMDAVLASRFPRARLIVQSFYPNNLDVAERRMPGVETALLTLSPLNGGAPAFAASSGYEWVSPQWPVSRDFVDQAHGLGRRVVPFTLNARDDVLGAAAVGVEALITDDPLMAQRALGVPRSALVPDRLLPSAALRAPRYASHVARGRRFPLRLSGTDRGSGLAWLSLAVRRNANASTRWRPVGRPSLRPTRRFRGRPGATYAFRARARDRFGNLGPYVYGITSVPLDDRSRRLRYSRGWRRLRSRRAYGRTLRRAARPGPSLSLRFRGERVALIGPRSPRGGFIRVTVAGRGRTIDLRGETARRRVLFRSRRMRPGRHRLRVRVLGGGNAAIDAVAIEQGPRPPRP